MLILINKQVRVMFWKKKVGLYSILPSVFVVQGVKALIDSDLAECTVYQPSSLIKL